jgi:hypothetical protein
MCRSGAPDNALDAVSCKERQVRGSTTELGFQGCMVLPGWFGFVASRSSLGEVAEVGDLAPSN